MTSPTPIQIHISPTLTPYTVPLSTFTASRPAYTNFAVSTFIFHPSHSPSKLLLLQRAPYERAFPLKWEPPGGSTESSDPTIIHTAARETFEETGLRLKRAVKEIGNGVEFVTDEGRERWLKLCFEVEVVEVEEGAGVGGDGDGEVELDPDEHMAWVWAGEKEVREGKWEITTEETREVILKAFEMRRLERKRMQEVSRKGA